MTQKKQRIRSIVILIILVIAAFVAYFVSRSADAGSYAVITVDGEVYQTLPLAVDTEVTVKTERGYNIVCMEGGHVDVAKADCSNQVCVNTGKISRKGEVIACLPHGLTVTIEASEGEVDSVAY